MRVLVVGGGAREHACVWALLQSPDVTKVYCAPGNPGTAQFGENVPITVKDAASVQALARWAWHERVDLTIVGPELPLSLGLVDEFRSVGLAVCGPTQAAARIETSKAWARDFMVRHGIPGPAHIVTHSLAELAALLEVAAYPLVLKADGLAAGKGVLVAATREDAEVGLAGLVQTGVLGPGRETVVVEEFLLGREVSALCFTDGKTVWPMPPVCDYKRLGDGDMGPQTGGMGAYSPPGWVRDDLWQEVAATILWPTVAGLAAEGCPFSGFLYAGLLITPQGPQVLEFNARLGDPEAQALLPRLETDFAAITLAISQGRLHEVSPIWKEEATCGVVLAAGGYPEAPLTGAPISGLGDMQAGILVFQGGTALQNELLDEEGSEPPDTVTQAGLTAEEIGDLFSLVPAPRRRPFVAAITDALAGPRRRPRPLDIDALLSGPTLVTAGGRVLTVVGRGPTVAAARAAVYRNVERISFAQRQYRGDIAAGEQ